jgi:ferredoxin
MKTTIFYYSGTGNSLWAARKVASGLGKTDLISIPSWMKEKEAVPADRIGLVFPVHMWGLPPPIVRFVKALNGFKPQYLFAVAVDAGQVSNTLVQLKKLLAGKGLLLDNGFELKMPSNYIPWGGPGTQDIIERIFAAAETKMDQVIKSIKNQEKRPPEKGPIWQRSLLTLLYKLSYQQVPKLDRSFKVDEKCTRCGICSRICPAENITAVNGIPTWNHHCEQCLACLQWCPHEAIQFGKKTAQYPRYHHPDIQLKDMLE